MASGNRSLVGLISLFLIAASIVLLFFVILSGVKNTSPLKQTHFLSATTSTITGARDVTQWTYFYICGAGNSDCGKPVPDLPFGYAWLGGGQGAPADLLGKHGKGTTSTYYFYMWRFGWVFYLIALFFDVCAFFLALLAPCSRLASGFAGLTLSVALFFMTLAASLMTVTFVKARNSFRSAGITSQIGSYAFGFTWGAWFAIFIATILLFVGVATGGGKKHDSVSRRNSTNGNVNNTGFFRRQRRQSARRSFVDNDSQRRVKEEYA